MIWFPGRFTLLYLTCVRQTYFSGSTSMVDDIHVACGKRRRQRPEDSIRGAREGRDGVRLCARIGCELDNQAIAPAILLAGEGLYRLVQFGIGCGINDTRTTRKLGVLHAPLHPRVGQEVLDPVRLVGMLGDHVVPAVPPGEPDFYFPRPTTPPPGRRQVQVCGLFRPGHVPQEEGDRGGRIGTRVGRLSTPIRIPAVTDCPATGRRSPDAPHRTARHLRETHEA